MADYDYEKIFRDIEEKDNAERATSAITPEGGIPTVNFDGTPATAKAVIASPEPQKNLNEWDRLNYVEKTWNSFWGGIHNLQKSSAVDEITEKKKEADEGLSALFGSDDMDLDDASMEKFRMAYADKTVGGEYKKQKERELEEAIGDYIDLSKKDKDYYAPTVVSAASKATEGKGFLESIPAWFAEVSKDPFDYALYIAGSSAGAIAPFLATSMAGGFALNTMKLNSVARAVQAATMGAGSYNVEFGSYIENYLAEKGYDLSNIDSIKSALDKEDVNAIREKAFRRAAVVGAFDAVSAWIAPIRLNPSNSLRLLSRAATETVQDVAVPASRLYRVGKGIENMTLQTTLQGVMGGAGEAFGQLVNGEKINWGEVFAEAIGEFTTAPVEVVGLAYSANSNFNRETAIARNAQEINKNLQDISNVVTAVAAKLPDNGSLQQWCEAVGKDKTLFAFAQDVIDSGAIDKLKEVAPALAQQVIEAAEKKSDVNVPVSDILKLSATDEATARKLLNDVRLTADGMSPNQAEKFLKEGKKGIVEKFQKIVDDAKPDIELRKAIKLETDKIVNELVSTGTTKDVADLQVLPWASWLAVRAKQTGMKPSEIMEKVRLRIQGEETAEGALNQQATGKGFTGEFLENQRKHLAWEPETDKDGNLKTTNKGLPPWVKNRKDFNTLVRRLRKFVREGSVGRHWYEDSARYVYNLVGGNMADADKIMQLIAIFSPQMKIGGNLLLALRAWDYYKQGLPADKLKLKTQEQNKKAVDVLYNNKPWNGRKTSSFYQNLMYALVNEHPEEARAAGLDVDEFLKGQSTIDMWMRRAFGYPNDSTSDDKGGGAYTFAERTLAKIAASLNQKLQPGEEPWTTHQVQSSIWTSIMSRYEMAKEETDLQYRDLGLAEEVPVLDNKTGQPIVKKDGTVRTQWTRKTDVASVAAQLALWNKNANRFDSQSVIDYSGSHARSFATEFTRMAQTVTWEAIPSVSIAEGKAIREASPAVRRMFTDEVAHIFDSPDAFDAIGKLLGVHLGSKAKGDGAYDGVISPNFVTTMLPIWWGQEGEPSKDFVRKYCRTIQYVCKQDAVPFFRVENRPAWLKNNGFKVGNKKFATQAEAQAYCDEMNKKAKTSRYKVTGSPYARGVTLVFDRELTQEKLKEIQGKLKTLTGHDIGFTRVSQNKIIAVNFRDQDGVPFVMTDEEFVEALDSLDVEGIEDRSSTWVDSEYGHVQDWATDPEGKEILELLGVSKNEGNDTSGLQRSNSRYAQDVRHNLDGWKAEYQRLLKKYNKKYVQELEKRLQAAKEPAKGQVRSSQNRPLTQPRPLFQRGYIGRSESVRASEARQEGQKPLSKWTKKAIIEAMKANGAPEELLRKAEAQPLWVLQQSVLSKTSWHHTGPNYQKTDFYGINDDYSDEKLGASWVSERIDEAAKAYSADYTEEAKKFAEFALSDFLAFDYYKEHQLDIFKKDRDFKRYTAYQNALDSVEEEAHKRAEEFHKRRDTQSSRPLTQRDVVRALEQLGYHGSPYNFDRFTLSHIGSGEGAQAHGWGLYFALNRQIAEAYRDRLADARTTYNGKPLYELHNELRDELKELTSSGKPLRGERLAKAQLLTSKMLLLGSFFVGGKAAVKVEKNAPKSTHDAYKWLTEEVYPNLKLEKDGKVYTAEIPDDDVMLREEKKISEQSELIQNAVRKAMAGMEIKPDAEEVEDFLDGLENSDLGNMPKTIEKIQQMFSNNDERLSSDVSIVQALKDTVHQDAVDIYEWNKEDNDANDITVEEIESNCQNTLKEYLSEITRLARKNGDVDIGNLTGREVYSLLKDQFLSARSTSLYLNKFGIKGMRYNGSLDGECAVVWDEESIKILNALEQSMQSGPRGTYMPQNTSDTNSMSGVMTLMQTRDKSTFLHESAHVWLDADTMLAKNIAEKVKSGQEITDGEKAFLKNLGGFFRWGQSEGVIDLGVTDDISTVADAVIRWSQMTTNDQRMMHELFAEGFESYLMSGTAPNPEMRTVFGRFKKWLMDIYARATRQPRPISREVRKLYDLMFATQQQAQDTETRLGLQAMFKAADAKKLGMTDAEVQAYEELQEQATLETEGLVAKMVRGTMRIFGKARQDEIARIEKDKEAIAKKEAELLEEPRYRAVAMLNARQTVLDIRQMQGYDTDTIDALDAKGWISHDGGVSPDVLASMAGTTDAVGLIGDILDIDTVGDAHDEALRILAFEERKEFGDEGVFDELRANLAAYNDTRSRLLTAEYNAIARMLGNQQILRSAAREYAIEQIGNTKMSDLHPYTFVQAEQRCAREAEEALRKGDYASCLEAKRGQVLNHELARAALEAQERMDKGIRAVRRAMKSKTIHPQYKQLIAALVNAHAISNMTKAEREEFAKVEGMHPEKVTEFLAKLEENGTPVDGVAEFLQTHEHVQDMTAYTAEDFFGVVKQVATLGRNVLNQSLTEIAESVKEVVALGKEKLNEAADVQGRKVLKNQRSPMTRKERAFDSVAKFLLSNVKIQSWCRIFDRNKDGGFFWNLFIRSANKHANFEAEQRARCSQVLREKLLPAFKKSADEDPIAIPGFDRPFTHGMRLAVALNLGNESNKQRLITNDPRFTTEALQAIMDSLTEADWRAVEAVWQLFESFKTAIGEKEMRVYGVEPEWIKYEPFQVTTKEGKTITVSGGYYPVKYDPVASNKVDKRTDAEATEQDLRGAYQSATTRRSFTQSRVTGDVTDMPLRLDMSALYEGLNDVIHDLAWHEWLIDTKRVLDGAGSPDSGLRAAIKERYGYNVAKEFEEWRKDIALGGRSEGSSEALSFCLRNVGMATMGYSLTSAAVQLTGVGYVIPRTGVKAFTVALGKYLTRPLKTRRFVNSQSQAMLLRAQTQFKELAQIRNRLDQGKGFRAWMVDHAYSMMTFMQGIVDSVCWQAAYEKFSRQGYEGKELTALCDQTVIDTQSSGNISDMSRIERDKRGLARMMTMFYSWMNAALNMVVTTGMSEENKAKKIASLFWMCAVMPLIEQTFRDSLAAKGDDDDDDDDELAWMREDLGTIVEFNLGLLPVTREFSTAAESLVKGEPVFDYRGPAGLRLLSNVTGGVKTLANPDERKITRAITDLGGSLLGLPSVQINRTVKGIRAINSGQAEGVDAIKAPFFGFKGKIDD